MRPAPKSTPDGPSVVTDALKPYPAYRDSGAEWIGRVPAHWTVLPNRAVYREARERDHPAATMLSVTIKHGVIEQRALLSTNNKKDNSKLDKSAYKLVRPGDIVYNKMRAWQGAIAASQYRGIVSPAYVVQRPNDGVNPRFLHHLLRTPAFAAEAELWSYGITSDMWSLRPEHFKLIRGCLPPLAEQFAIVRYLDGADRRIRRYIRAKERLIELLEERKRALVQEAVTGRIDVRTGQPYSVYKDSGIDWLGKVPEHWEVSRVKTEFHCLNHRRVPLSGTQRGAMKRREYDYYGASGVIDKVDDYLFDDELLLIAEDGANLVLRNLPLAIIARGKFWVNNHAHILKPKRGHIEFLCCVMENLSYLPWISGSAQPKLTLDRLMSIPIAVPPRLEQDHIVNSLAAATLTVASAAKDAQRQAALLREYRTRLIADVVTGKLDVREAAARLPETDPTAWDRDRAETIPIEPNLRPTEHHTSNEAVP